MSGLRPRNILGLRSQGSRVRIAPGSSSQPDEMKEVSPHSGDLGRAQVEGFAPYLPHSQAAEPSGVGQVPTPERPLPIHPALEQKENLSRVKARIGPAVELYWRRAMVEQDEFHASDLLAFVNRLIPGVAPDSPLRVLRSYRLEGRVNFCVVDRSKSLYRALPLGHAVERNSPTGEVIAELREEIAKLRQALRQAGVDVE
jgi:hypothetical protein